MKIKSTISNANAFIEVQKEFHFDNYIWSFTNNKTIINDFNKLNEVPAETILSNEISKDLKKGDLFLLDQQLRMLLCNPSEL